MRYLARAFLAGDLSTDGLITRADETLGRKWRWVRSLALRYFAAFEGKTRPRLREVISFLTNDELFRQARIRHKKSIQVVHRIAGQSQMQPVETAAAWELPPIQSVAELAAWLHITSPELGWFSDLKHLQRKSKTTASLCHYQYQIERKKSGGLRLIEAPKQRMKTLQRTILADLLNRIPPHAAAHGFVRGRNIRTFAAPHAGQHVLLRVDLRDFFPSIRRNRVQAIFRTLGYPEPIADLLGGIATTRTPRSVFRGIDLADIALMRALYEQSHLPQGAPTSPALANACSYRLDCRLTALAAASGAQYTRYADDLAFSGDRSLARGVERFATHVAAIAMDEGFAVNFRKTRIMHRGVQQHLAGLTVNQHPNVSRVDFDRLKATLTNCIRNGPAAENRDHRQEFRAHLEGRVAFVESINPTKGSRLRHLLNRIDWN